MKKSILAVLLLFFVSGLANAANVKFQWTPPTTRESCEERNSANECILYTPLPPDEIGGYNIYYGTTQGAYNETFNVTDPTATSATISLPAGLIYFAVVTTIDTESRESIYSEFISVAVDHADPKQPTGLTATVLPD